MIQLIEKLLVLLGIVAVLLFTGPDWRPDNAKRTLTLPPLCPPICWEPWR